MAELEQQNTASDPLASLHKMSTTAGIVSADYVAISNQAVFSAVLGAATSLAIVFASDSALNPAIWLLPGLPGIVLGIAALRSISRSNGTLSGRAVAIAGIMLSLGFACAAAAMVWQRQAALEPDKQAINQRIIQLGDLIAKGDYPAAYKLFDPAWREKASFDKFEQGMLNLQHPNYGGKVDRFEPNNLFGFNTAAGSRLCITRVRITFAKRDFEVPIMIQMRQQADGEWLVIYTEMFRDVDPFEVQKKSPTNQPLSK